jgi:AcrR family transcriptional regulator
MSVTDIDCSTFMSVTDITRLAAMGRWEPDARGRMRVAAMELYAERGFEQTTVAEIAERAGVTERTFFRHFADKREVLFAGSEQLRDTMVERIASTPAAIRPLDAVVEALAEATSPLEHAQARARIAIITAHPGLQEREALKMVSLSRAAAAALRARGVPDPAAALAAESGIAVFKAGFEQWVTDPTPTALADRMRDALAQLRLAVT